MSTNSRVGMEQRDLLANTERSIVMSTAGKRTLFRKKYPIKQTSLGRCDPPSYTRIFHEISIGVRPTNSTNRNMNYARWQKTNGKTNALRLYMPNLHCMLSTNITNLFAVSQRERSEQVFAVQIVHIAGLRTSQKRGPLSEASQPPQLGENNQQCNTANFPQAKHGANAALEVSTATGFITQRHGYKSVLANNKQPATQGASS